MLSKRFPLPRSAKKIIPLVFTFIFTCLVFLPENGNTADPVTIGLKPLQLSQKSAEGQDAVSQSFEIWNFGDGTLTYTISSDVSWLSVNPSSGTSPGEHDTILVNYSSEGLPRGIYRGAITLTASGVGNSPRKIPVILSVGTQVAFKSSTIPAGEGHSLLIKPNGTLRAWGKDDHGQLGDGTSTGRNSSVQVSGYTWLRFFRYAATIKRCLVLIDKDFFP